MDRASDDATAQELLTLVKHNRLAWSNIAQWLLKYNSGLHIRQAPHPGRHTPRAIANLGLYGGPWEQFLP